jgi:entericidin B
MTKFLLVLSVVAMTLAGCNTVRGIGQDIEKGGEAIQKVTK